MREALGASVGDMAGPKRQAREKGMAPTSIRPSEMAEREHWQGLADTCRPERRAGDQHVQPIVLLTVGC